VAFDDECIEVDAPQLKRARTLITHSITGVRGTISR
tara:strand:+ start:3496 stop:3603 length:108 start_codon:yes stop_codon:yes gene_type:complete